MVKGRRKAGKTRKPGSRSGFPRYSFHLEALQEKTNWTLSRTACSVCKGTRAGEPVYRRDDVCICRDCALKVFKRHAKATSLENWTSRDFIDSLSPEADLARRFIVLFRYPEAEERLARTGPENLETIRRRLLDHLGHTDGHPLEREVRTAAHHACVAMGEEILELLVSVRKPKAPWQFVANQVLTGGAIDPEHPKVRAMLQAAAKDPSPSVRVYAAGGVGLHDAHWARQLLETLERDPNPLVREAVAGVRAGHRERARKKPSPSRTPSPKKPKRPLTPVESAINDTYPVHTLRIVYETYLSSLIDGDRFAVDGSFSVHKLRKSDLVEALGEVFSEKALFDRLCDKMPEGVKTVLNTLVWEGVPKAVSEFGDVEPPLFFTLQETRYGRKTTVEQLDPAYVILPLSQEYDWRSGWQRDKNRVLFYLPDELRSTFKGYLPPPPEYHLEGVEAIGESRFTFSGEARIFARIEIISTYIRQGGLKFAKSGNKVLKHSMRKMIEACDLQEFYPDVDRDLDYLRGQIMAAFLASEQEHPLTEGTPEALKAAFEGFFRGEAYRSFALADLLTHLKGRGYYLDSGYGSYSDREKSVRGSLPALLDHLPEDRWVETETLFKHCRCREIDLDVIHRSLAAQHVYFYASASSTGYGHTYKSYVGSAFYDSAVAAPLLRAVLFFFAAFGLVEIAYDRPRNRQIKQEGKPYLSVYDGLRYVRLTELGRFVAGRADQYEAGTMREAAAVSLDENRLMIHLHGRDPIKEMALSQMAERVAENCYKVSFHTFLKDCKTEADIQKRKALFQQHIEAEPAGIWKRFLEEVADKVDPLVPVGSMAVFRLKENRELISLVARDPELKKYILKAEDYHILIHQRHLGIVRNRLEAFGYLMQDLK